MKKGLLKRALCMAAVMCALCAGGCREDDSNQRRSHSYLELFDTVTQIIGYDDEESFEQSCEAVYSLLEEYHQLTDIYHSYDGVNNVRTINLNAGEAVSVDEKLIDLLLFAKEMYERTDGLCNIAMGSVLSVWHDYREQGISDPENAALPSMEELSAAAEHCVIENLIIDEQAGTVCLADADMSLDMGAVAKGYAAERAAELLMSMGITEGYTLNIGGNIRTIGGKQDGSEWQAGIQNPDTESDEPYVLIVSLSDAALVTSGNYQRYYEVDGVRYHHIINPNTLMPENYFSSVSVLAADSGIADALSTALFNVPVEQGKEILEGFGDIQAVWVMPDGSIEYTDGFEEHIVLE